jgi:CubicO group peptidase (beta-lactamase class C family)
MTNTISEIENYLSAFIAAGELDGAALSVAQRGRQVIGWQGGSAAPGRPATARTLWPLASISKTYSAAAIMALVERGVLLLSTPVRSLLPKFTGGGKENATLRHLLTHTAGMIYESPDMDKRMAELTPVEALIDEAYGYDLLFAPGAGHAYADYNYLLAGEMAARATGRPFAELVHELVLAPAGLVDTWMPPTPAVYDQLAIVPGALAEGTVGAQYNTPYALDLAHPAFGVVATADDLMRFGLNFAPTGPRFLSAATVRAMTVDQTGGRCLGWAPALGPQSAPAYPVAWGLGFYFQQAEAPGVFGDLLSFGTYGHGGASGCQLVIDPVADIVIAIVTNRHARTGRERWSYRLRSTINMTLAALTA